MTKQEAINNIGKPFKWLGGSSFDIIREVKEDGTVIGDFMEVHCEDCRLKQGIPDQLKPFINISKILL